MSTTLFEQSAAVFRSVLGRVRADQLGLPTPCAPLDVAQLIEKAIGHQDWVRGALQGQRVPPEYPSLDPAGYLTAFDWSTTAMIAELTSDGAMSRPVTIAASLTFPGSDVMILAARNIFQFAWDLARATGQDTNLAPDVASELLRLSRTHLVPQRGPGGFFGPEFVPGDRASTADVLAGFLGRVFSAQRQTVKGEAMSYLPTVPPDEAADAVQAMYDKDLAAQGYVANYTRAFSTRPEVLQGWLALKNAITSGMDPRLFELATVAAATAIRSSYCSLVHGNILATSYIPAEKVASIAAGDASEALDPADAAVVRFAQKVALEAEKVSQEDIDELRDFGLSDVDVFNVVLAAAARCFFSTVLDATGTLPDAALHDLPEQLRAALTVGREIAPQA